MKTIRALRNCHSAPIYNSFAQAQRSSALRLIETSLREWRNPNKLNSCGKVTDQNAKKKQK